MTTPIFLFCLAPMYFTGTEGPVWAAKKSFLPLIYKNKLDSVEPMRKEMFYKNQKIQSTIILDKIPEITTCEQHFYISIQLNLMWNDPSPVTLTVALRWNSLNQVTVVWPHATEPTKCIFSIEQWDNAGHLSQGLFYKVISLVSTSRPTKCSNGKTIKLKFTV